MLNNRPSRCSSSRDGDGVTCCGNATQRLPLKGTGSSRRLRSKWSHVVRFAYMFNPDPEHASHKKMKGNLAVAPRAVFVISQKGSMKKEYGFEGPPPPLVLQVKM